VAQVLKIIYLDVGSYETISQTFCVTRKVHFKTPAANSKIGLCYEAKYFRLLIVNYLFLILFLCSFLVFANEDKEDTAFKVAFFNPHSPTEYWQGMTTCLQRAADDLNVDVSLHFSHEDHHRYITDLEKLLASEQKPDYVIFKPYKKTARRFLELGERYHVEMLSIDAEFHGDELKRLKQPRVVFKNWLAHIDYDNYLAGYDLANYLIIEAKNRNLYNQQNRIDLIGISGPIGDTVAQNRIRGLRQAIAEHPEVNLFQIVNTIQWRDKEAVRVYEALSRRYSQPQVVWTAADLFASAINDLANENKTFLIGGVDWLDPAIKGVQNGWNSASLGGNQYLGAWALVLLYDYHHKVDFIEQTLNFHLKMEMVTGNNIEDVKTSLNCSTAPFNFRKFSRKLSPKLSEYNFQILKR